MTGAEVYARLTRGGFIAAEEETAELLRRAGDDPSLLEAMLERRLRGEPLAWITGETRFCDVVLRVDPGVYVPRWHTEQLALRAAGLLPAGGTALDLCTGCGAVAALLIARCPAARVLATDLDPRAVACAIANGVEALQGDLLAPVPAELRGGVDLITAVVPYVPTQEMALLQRDTFTYETPLAYDGGPDGTALLRRVIAEAPAYLRQDGRLLLELGGGQADLLSPDLDRWGFTDRSVLRDAEGDVRGLEARLASA